MTEPSIQSELMTLDEACSYWRVSKSTGRRIIEREGIIRQRIGSSSQMIRYRREDVEKVVTLMSTEK